ncbi:hypothetical protein IAT38_008388 [Cryptococcus sp. DSM 104549]
MTSGTNSQSRSRSRSPSPSARASKQRRTSHPHPRHALPSLSHPAPPNPNPASAPTHTALPPLKRNSACKQCRKRRIRCDAGKPHCASCARSFDYLKRTHPDDECVKKGVQCYYDDDGEQGPEKSPERRVSVNGGESTASVLGKQKQTEKELSPRSSSDGSSAGVDHQETIRELEKKVAELQHTLKNQTHPSTSVPHPSTSTTSATSTTAAKSTTTPVNPGFSLFNLPPEKDPSIWPNAPSHPDLMQNLLGGESGVGGWLGAVGGAGMGGVGGMEMGSLWGVGGFGAANGSSGDGLMGGQGWTGGMGGMEGMPPSADFSNLGSTYMPSILPSEFGGVPIPNALPPQPSQAAQPDQTIHDPIASWSDSRGCPSLYKPPVVAGWVDASVGSQVERVGRRTSAGGSGAGANADGAGSGGWGRGREGSGGQAETEVGVCGWPAVLPSPELTHQLIEIFFTRIPSITRIIHRPTLLARIARGPSHPNFPHRALLHAICAIAAYYCAPACAGGYCGGDGVDGESRIPGGEDGEGSRHGREGPQWAKNRRFSETQAMHAMRGWNYNYADGKGLFDRLQAMVILGYWFQTESRWTDCWITIGCATRLCICLGLVHHNTYTPIIHSCARSAILAPPANDVEREERRATMYYVLCSEVTASASPGWAETLPGDEMTTKLPASRLDFERGGEIAENPQDRHSPDIYYNHPVPDSFVMVVKGQLLLSRANKFARRCRAMDSEERAGVKETAMFRRLDGDIATFVLSFPPELREPVQASKGYGQGLDTDIISAHLLPQIATILLHEPLADLSDPTCPSALRIISAAKLCSSVVTQVMASQWCKAGAGAGQGGAAAGGGGGPGEGLSGCVGPLTCFCLITAARTLILFYMKALEAGDIDQAEVLSSEIAMFRKIFKAHGKHSATGNRYLAIVDVMVRAIHAGVSPPSPSSCSNSSTLPHCLRPHSSINGQGNDHAPPPANPPSFFPPTSHPYSPYRTYMYGFGSAMDGEADAAASGQLDSRREGESATPSSGSGVRSTGVSTPGTTGYTHSHTTTTTALILTPTAGPTSISTGADLPELRDSHPDSIELNALRKALIAGDRGAGAKIQEWMDKKRGFVRARRDRAVMDGGGEGAAEREEGSTIKQIWGAEGSAEKSTHGYAMGWMGAQEDLSVAGGGFGVVGGGAGGEDAAGANSGSARAVIYEEPTPLSWLDWPEDRQLAITTPGNSGAETGAAVAGGEKLSNGRRESGGAVMWM